MSQLDQTGGKRRDRVCTDPKDSAIATPIAMRVFERRLRFANTAQTTDPLRMGQSYCILSMQYVMQLGEYVLSSGKIRVALVGNVPERGRWHTSSPLYALGFDILTKRI